MPADADVRPIEDGPIEHRTVTVIAAVLFAVTIVGFVCSPVGRRARQKS
jgi:nitrate reductase NapE component